MKKIVISMISLLCVITACAGSSVIKPYQPQGFADENTLRLLLTLKSKPDKVNSGETKAKMLKEAERNLRLFLVDYYAGINAGADPGPSAQAVDKAVREIIPDITKKADIVSIVSDPDGMMIYVYEIKHAGLKKQIHNLKFDWYGY